MPAEDESQVPEESHAGWGHWPGALVWASLQPHWQEGPRCSQPCTPCLDAKELGSRTMCRVPLLPPSKLSLMVTGHCLHRQVVSTAAFDTLLPNAALGRPWCACWASSALWALSGSPLPTLTPSVCLGPCPAPGCSSCALPRGFPVCPRACPQLLMCSQGCLLSCFVCILEPCEREFHIGMRKNSSTVRVAKPRRCCPGSLWCLRPWRQSEPHGAVS